MVLLKNMMEEIRTDTSGYNTKLWHYRVSGNILELIVQLSSRRDHGGYRTAVISAGQAIRSLTCRLEELGHYTLIQSFPSLEHPELVASVRLYNTYGIEKGKPAAQTAAESFCSIPELLTHLKKVASRHELNLLHAPEKLSPKDHLACHSAELYLLTSRFDNPFYWLKTGYWREEAALILRNCRLNSRMLHTDISSFYDGIRYREGPLQNSCVQAAICLCRSPEIQAFTVQ